MDNRVRQFLNKIFCPSQRLTMVRRDIHYVSLPYLGPPLVKLVKYLKNVLQRYYPQVEFKFSLSNSLKIKSFFYYKDHLPLDLRSGIVYKYTCGICNDSYIGSSIKQARVRFSQHHGFSFITSRPISCPTNSSIQDHCNSKDHMFKYEYFNVLDSGASNTDLRILESLYILKFNLSINIDRSAVQLYIA